MAFKYGCDPELFLKVGTEFISAETKDGPLIPGTKANPFPVRGGAIQVDGVAAEFNINPTTNFEGFFGNIKSVVQTLRQTIHKRNPHVVLTATPTATFKQTYFKSLPEKTLELGCEPDYNANNGGKANPRPSTDKPFRTGSGHIHIGWTDNADPLSDGHMLDCMLVVKELDRYLYAASKGWDSDTKRQSLYGKPGSFRPKKYGVEYRPLSNAWLRKPDTIKTVFTIVQGVMKSIDSGKHTFDDPYIYDKDKPHECIASMFGE